MSCETPEQRAYEFPELWNEGWWDAQDRQRVKEIADWIPPSVSSLIDVGCGGGLFLNHLAANPARQFSRLLGLDRSRAGLTNVSTLAVRAAIDRLPCLDRAFDAVSCMEVLEHLPPPVYFGALAELARVAREWIVVTVPYRQDLLAGQCRCPACLTSFHPDFHMRAFDEEAMGKLFAAHGFVMTALRHLGRSAERYDHILRNRVRAIYRQAPTPTVPSLPVYAICPLCGFHEASRLAEELRRREQAHMRPAADVELVSPIRQFLRRSLPQRVTYRWIGALYRRDRQHNEARFT